MAKKVVNLNVSLELPIEVIKKIFDTYCIHKKEYDENKPFPESWIDCEECILKKMTWIVGNGDVLESVVGVIRDACFAIWHEDILRGAEIK